MKRYRSLIILLAVLLTLSVAYMVFAKINRDAEEEDTKTSQIEVTNFEDITYIQYSGSTDTMSFIKEDDTWYSENDLEFPLKQSELQTLESTFGNIYAERELKGGDTLADYGLENPAYVITLRNADGEEQNIYIGNAAGEDYYMTVDDKEKVYTVGSSLVSAMNFDLDSMIQLETFPGIGTDNIKKVSVTKAGETTEYDAGNSEQEEDITAIGGGLGAMYFTSCADYNVTDDELASYGLDTENRTTVTIVYTDDDDKEQTFTLYVGSLDETQTYYYVQMEGSKMVNTSVKETVENVLNLEEE